MTTFLRDVDVYVDVAGHSDTADAIERLRQTDDRAYRAITRKIALLRQMDMRQAIEADLVKRPTATIHVLRVQSGPVAYRLPFFESPCHDRRLVLLTHCEHRSSLRGDRYKMMIEAAERRRQDWVRRFCK